MDRDRERVSVCVCERERERERGRERERLTEGIKDHLYTTMTYNLGNIERHHVTDI